MAEAVTITPGTRVINGRQLPQIGTWTIDASHASFEFVARHLMAKVRGRFPDVSGEAHITEVPEESSLEVEIDASTIDTRDTDRDAHLRSSDFFGVEDHPTISFRSTAVRRARARTSGRSTATSPSRASPARSPSTSSSSAAPSTRGATSASASPGSSPRSTGRTGA